MPEISHFNKMAAEWDSPEKIRLMKTLADKTREVLALNEPVDIMDFGCGTGLFGLELANTAKSLVGVDTSKAMLDVFDKKTMGADHIVSINIDLERDTLDQSFDLIVSSMAFHHLSSPMSMIGKLKNILRPGGRLAIVDLDKEDGTFHPDNEGMGVKHFGFAEQEMQVWAQEAGMTLNHTIINELQKNNKIYRQFLAVFS